MNLFKFFCPVLLGALVSCAGRSDWRKDASNLIGEGRFSQLDSLLEEAEPGASEQELRAIDSLREVMRRLRIEFCYNEEQILSRIRQRVSDTVSPEQIRRWEKSGKLEMRRIDSRKRYFSRSVGNLILLAPELEGLRRIDSSEIGFRERHAARVIAATDSLGMCTNPVTMTIRYTLVVEPDAVPEGDTIRCWLPYPQEGLPRQTGVELISAWPERYVVAPKGTPQRSICFEQPARRDSATVFRLAFRVTTRAQYFDPEELSKRVEPYDTLSEVYRKYTAQRPPHLVFSERIEPEGPRVGRRRDRSGADRFADLRLDRRHSVGGGDRVRRDPEYSRVRARCRTRRLRTGEPASDRDVAQRRDSGAVGKRLDAASGTCRSARLGIGLLRRRRVGAPRYIVRQTGCERRSGRPRFL